MAPLVSKSRFKAQALELLREVERTGTPIIITKRGIPVLRVTRYRDDPNAALMTLRNSVVRYARPTEPVCANDWASNL